MSDQEAKNKEGHSVKDKRRFVMKNGEVIDTKPEKEKEAQDSRIKEETAPREEKDETSSDAGKDKGEKRERPLPPLTFSSLVVSVSTSAMVHLGELPDPITRKMSQDLELARQNIDLLAVLEEKTKGNLDEEEQELLRESLYALRLHYVQMCKGKSCEEKG